MMCVFPFSLPTSLASSMTSDLMRLFALALALILIPTSVQAQAAQADVLAALLSAEDEEDDGGNATCIYIAGAAVAVPLVIVIGVLAANACGNFSDEAVAGNAVLVRIAEDEGLAVATEETATHAIRVTRRPRTGVGLEPSPTTVEVIDVTSGRPLSLDALGGRSATVHTETDLLTLLRAHATSHDSSRTSARAHLRPSPGD